MFDYMYKLAICVITWNRSRQLKAALDSCLHCRLPRSTQFVIVDNASTDDTETVVRTLLDDAGYDYVYKKLERNLGVGGGRNYCFQLLSSEYSYFLDDDAVVDAESFDTFFQLPLEIFEKYKEVGTITTRIKDMALACDREAMYARYWKVGSYPCILMFYGGSHFLRNEVFENRNSLYDEVKYGHEELSPSLFAMDRGFKNIYIDGISIIHCPLVNKWAADSRLLLQIGSRSIYNQYITKSKIYPTFFSPFVYLAYKMRLYKHLRKLSIDEDEYGKDIEIRNTSKLGLGFVFRLFWQFGLKIF